MNGKVSIVFDCNCFPKMADFSRLGPLQAVTYIVKVVISEKWCRVRCHYTSLIGSIIRPIDLWYFL